MPDPPKINKTIREIRKENRDKDKRLRDLGLYLIQKNTTVNLKKLLLLLIIVIFNMKVLKIKIIHYQSDNILILSGHI